MIGSDPASLRNLARRAREWPSTFRAHLNPETGHWRLLGADRDVDQELRICAEHAAPDLGLPLESDPVDAFLWRLKDAGHHVRQMVRDRKRRFGSATIFTKFIEASISPLRDAVIEYLSHRGSEAPESQPRPKARMQDQGQAAAVERNRQREARIRIIEAFQRLGVPRKDWPPFVQKFTGPANRQLLAPAPFQLPAFHRLRQSIEDWAKTADAEWQRHRDAQIQTWAFWVGVGVDDKITEAKRSRGPGKTGRNASANTRHEWAALRLSGLEWKQIAIDYCVKEDRVRKAATDILLGANWARRRR